MAGRRKDHWPTVLTGYVSSAWRAAVDGAVPLSRWDEKPGPIMYAPSLQQGLHWRAPFGPDRIGMTFIARSAGDPTNLVAPIRRLLAEVDPDKPPTDIRTLEQYLGNQLDGRRQYTFLVGLFGAIGTILAATGTQQLWGVTATAPLTFVSAAIALTAIALLASFVPTRQAVAVDPTIALRHE